MAELLILNLNRQWFLAQSKAAEAGDQEALVSIQNLWADYQHLEIECFLCAELVQQRPPFMLTLPDYGSTTRLLGLPLCSRCQSRPSQERFARALRLLKKMWSKRYGKNVTFQYNPAPADPSYLTKNGGACFCIILSQLRLSARAGLQSDKRRKSATRSGPTESARRRRRPFKRSRTTAGRFAGAGHVPAVASAMKASISACGRWARRMPAICPER